MKRLAITMGDPGGIGPEIIVKALSLAAVRKYCRPIIIGDKSVMEEALSLLKLPLRLRMIRSPKESKLSSGIIEIIDNSLLSPFRKGGVHPGDVGFKKGTAIPQLDKAAYRFSKHKPDAESGKVSVSYIKKAVQLALAGEVAGIVTAPISKEALKMAGFKWPGHTEMLAELTKTKDYAMMFSGGPLKVILVTIHIALEAVPRMVTKQRVLKTIRLAKMACDMLGIRRPRIAVAGLNPHAGESGLFGKEEILNIIPAIRQAMRENIPISGPYPPDTIFYKAYRGDVDLVVCMYHDQGLIPLKMIAFDKGVNVTVGLPFVRTSPDHGTAYDIAWKGAADPSSMIEAIKLAVKLKV